MTELEALSRSTTTYSASESQTKGDGGAFAGALEGAVSKNAAPSCAPNDVDPNVELPERWFDEKNQSRIFSAHYMTDNVIDFLKSMGVDTENRVPTHKITKEQLEWLASRNDLDALKNVTANGITELAQLFGDLVYLNVLSASDVYSIWMPTLPLLDKNHTAALVMVGDVNYQRPSRDERLLTFLEKSMAEHLFSLGYLRKNESDPDYLQRMDDFITNEGELLSVLSELFGGDVGVSEGASSEGAGLDIDYEALLAAHKKAQEEYEEGKKIDVAIEEMGRYIETRRKELEYLREKDYENLLKGKTELARLHDFLNGKRRLDVLMLELFGIFPPEVYAETKNVTDATDKLSEDFGGLLS